MTSNILIENHQPKGSDHSVALWLILCCAMVFAMALLGAITRLTESGLSITDWNPIMGAIPPLNDNQWEQAFSAYREIPQYKIFHQGMTLDEFKSIFFWEWLHRLWGRIIGLIFVVPLLVFLVQKKITRTLAMRLLFILCLGATQGFIGWFMVQSGLDVRTSVSPYRLALHLVFALLVYGTLLWTALDNLPISFPIWRQDVSRGFMRHGWVTLGILFLTIIWGALVAGLHAGEAYNTWPLMEGEVIPSAAFTLLPRGLNFFENLALVQFIHRWLGPLTMIMVLVWVGRGLNLLLAPFSKRWLLALAVTVILQVLLGLSTLLSHVDKHLAVAHQAGAITILTLLLINLHFLRQKGRLNILV